ncbi:MAG: glycosyltransferase family 4 protein [Pirellulales bacterium]
MRIAFFSTMGGLPWGGSEELWCRAADELLDRGHEVLFNTRQWPTIAAPLQRLIDKGATPSFRSRLRLGRSLRRLLERSHLVNLKFFPWLKKSKPEFVVISVACHTEEPQIASACHRLGIPYAILLQAAGYNNWVRPQDVPAFRAAYSNARQSFFVSAENRTIVESNLAFDLSHTEIVDNPFMVRADVVPAWPSTEPFWKLAYVGRIHFVSKSQDLLIHVLRQPKWRARPLKITMWGSDDGYLGQIQEMIKLYGLEEQIAYGGFSNDIESLWSQHHGLLLPSRMEGNALSLIEAMMCGRMPITTDVGRAAELIDDGKSGFVAPAATAKLIDEVLERAWQRRHDWHSMGQEAARVIRQRHSLKPGEDFADRILVAANSKQPVLKVAA